VELAPGGLCRLNADGSLEQANQTVIELLGCETQSEVLTFAGNFGLFEDDRDGRELLRMLRNGGEVRAFAARFRRQGGGAVPVCLTGRALRNSDGSIDGFVLLVTADTTCEEPAGQG